MALSAGSSCSPEVKGETLPSKFVVPAIRKFKTCLNGFDVSSVGRIGNIQAQGDVHANSTETLFLNLLP